MKNYVKPSLEINKFEVEDIMSNSGVMGGYSALTGGKAVYDQYLAGADGVAGNADDISAAANVVEFQW